MSVSALVLAGLNAASLLLKQFPDYDQRQRKKFEADYAIYKLQKTLPDDHPDIDDSLFIRARDRLFKHVEAINKFAETNGKNGVNVSIK